MNKKFSTLLLGALLAGAFTTANAVEVYSQEEFAKLISDEGILTLPTGDNELIFSGDVNFTVPFASLRAGNTGGEYFIVTKDGVTIKGENGATLTGRMVLAAENVTVSGLTIINKGVTSPKANDYSLFCNKSAISVLANAVTITGNTFLQGTPEGENQLMQGITLIPSDQTVEYVITNNTFKGLNRVVGTDPVDPAYAVSLELKSKIDAYALGYLGEKSGVVEYTSPETTNFDASELLSEEANNTFTDCAFNYATVLNPAGDYGDGDLVYKVVSVTPLENNANSLAVKKSVNQSNKETSLLFNGTTDELKEALGENFTTTANVAIQCNDGNILYGDAKAPNDKPVIVADVKALDASIDGYKLLKNIDGNYNLLVLKSSNGSNYVITIESGKAIAVAITSTNSISNYVADKASLWKVTEGKSNVDGKLYYTFTNQNGDVLEAATGAGTGTQDGEFYPYNEGAKYNNGIVLAVNSDATSEGSGVALNDDTPAYFGLYEAGKNVLSVEDLNYFEQDGFSVTIKYADADGKFTKEDIAGNEFVGHLTPMKRNGQEFVEAPATEEEFYLKNADGEYIVVNAKDNGDVAAEDVLYFTTLSEEALEHHLARVAAGDDQEYFGLFQAKVSASNQTDYKKLTVIDEMFVKLGDTEDDWASIGRWDKDSEPTLAASIETSLKPIQIALGSGKIVDKKAFLQKGKFYTVEIVASTEDNDPMVGKKLVAGAQDNDQENYWVKSYGNVLEGQFALTIEKDTDGKEYYVFTNRENLDVANSSYIDSDNYYRQLFVSFSDADDKYYEGIPVGSLYTTDEDNEYRYGIYTYKIDTVAGHKASDGYQTLADVKNNKFYIGYASGVFGGNAWLVENHEGDENHVIGLDINQEDALIFTAKEYAAARQLKVEDKKSHKYYYAPSDSIYVISELGYFDGDDYKTTLDTLKLVSYSFVNQYTEPLIFSKNGENRYESKVYDYYKYNDKTGKYDIGVRYKNVEEAQKDAQHFALRIDGTKLNLRPVNPTVYSEDGNNVEVIEDSWSNIAWTETEYKNLGDDETKPDAYLYQGLNGNNKVYSGDAGEEGMLSNTYYLDREENDLFVVEPTEKPMYRTVINPLDTISIFRDDNSQSVLFEHNTFLGMENLSQYPEIAKAMIADTAYVRNNTYRPQYMLVVGADITPAGKWCPIHGDDPTCPDAHKVETSGWVEGRYLVNLVDTAIAWDAANKHKDNNPYINSEKYYRLGFVQAKHINDSLVIASTNDTLYVGSEDYNQAKFAFRYVDQEAGSFVIETANYNRLPGVEEAEINEDAPLGYLKWMNGVVVVVGDINNADVYNMNENETDTPTANEDIAVEEGVQVIAGNGAVTIQGAAGKTVVITNILGKAVANTTLTSDNQTINVPAGIVVVTVDGEAVKAIVK